MTPEIIQLPCRLLNVKLRFLNACAYLDQILPVGQAYRRQELKDRPQLALLSANLGDI